MFRVFLLASAVAVALGWSCTVASAQVLGTFRWQFAPHCNVLTVVVEQRGPFYQVIGTDDMCGAAAAAPARGTAHMNGDGSVGMAVSIQRPDGIAVDVTATLQPSTFHGTWRDNFRNSGDFTFNPPAAPTGPRRPITIVGNFAISYTATAAGQRGTNPVNFGLRLPIEPLSPQANYVPRNGATANCPGSATNPRAAVGHLCVYETSRANVGTSCIARTGPQYVCHESDDTGASLYVLSQASGHVTSAGRWVVTVP